MAKQEKNVLAKSGNTIKVLCGINQIGFVDGDVWRTSDEFYADVGDVAKIDVDTKERFVNMAEVIISAINDKYECKLVASDYDFKSGKISRSQDRRPQVEPQPQPTAQPTAQPQEQPVVQPQMEQPIVAMADTTPKTPLIKIEKSVIEWCKKQRNVKPVGHEFKAIRQYLVDSGKTVEFVDAHFLVAFPVEQLPVKLLDM